MPSPYKFQQDVIDVAVKQDSFAFLWDCGVGKTCAVINTVKQKLGLFPKTIIFAPKIALRNWVNEMKLWAPEEKSIGIVTGSPKQRLEIIKKNRILIANYECVRSKDVALALKEHNPQVVILDESHRIKSHKALQTKAIMDISKRALFKYIMTGTVATNNYLDLFSQYLFLDNGETLGKSFFGFRGRYFINKNALWVGERSFPNFVFNESMKQDLLDRIAIKSSFLDKTSVLDLPDLVNQTIAIDLTSEQARHYKEAKDDLISWLDGQEDNPLVIQNVLTKVLRLNEIANGYMKLNDETVHVFKDDPKLAALMELLDDLAPHKVIVFCVFKENYRAIKDKLNKRDYVELHGEVDEKTKFDNIDKFNNPTSGVRICIANPRSAGLAINLKAAKYSIFYSRNFSLEEYVQAAGRNYRSGSKELHDKIVHYNLVAANTIDEKIVEALHEKKSILSSISQIKNLLSN